jgi:hypothetical protein
MITACLITWKRQYNIPKIVENLLRYPFIDEIIIRDNSKCKNIINYGRYTTKTKNNIIYTQDDDCIVHNIQGIYDKFMEDPKRITYSGIDGYEEKIKDNIFGNKQMCMAGWGMMFDKSWVKVLDKYISVYGKDDCFYRETDRIFSLLLNRHHNFVPGGITHLEGKDDSNALCQQSDHVASKQLAIQRSLEIWKQ